MDEERYPPRKADDMIDITKVLIGINIAGNSKSWAMLEDVNKYLLNSKKNSRLYKDVLTESEYFIDDQGLVLKSRLSKSAVHKNGKVVDMDSFSGAKTIREIIEETNKFFIGLELKGYKEEIKKLRELHKKILALYESIDKGNPVYISAGDLDTFFDYIIDMYIYAFGNYEDPDISIECYDDEQRSLTELIDINNICIGEVSWDDCHTSKVLEKTNKGYSYKDKNGIERKVDVYRDLLFEAYYYVLDNGEMYTSPLELLKKSNSLSRKKKDYLQRVISLEDAVNLTIAKATPEDVALDMNLVSWMKGLFESSKEHDKIVFPILELRENDSLFVNCYRKAITDEPLISPNNIIEDIIAASDIVSNLAYKLKK